MSKFDVSDYVDVRERIRKFYDKYPEGSLTSEVIEYTDTRVTIKAWAWRTPDDPRPCDGISSLNIPGETPFTRGSEIENAQTSAWGRAIVAAGFADHRPLASAQEVANKQPGDEARGNVPAVPLTPRVAQPAQGSEASPAPVPRTPEEEEVLDALLALPGMTRARLELLAEAAQVPPDRRATLGELRAMLTIAQRPSSEPTSWPDKGTAAWKALTPYERAQAQAWHQKQKASA